LYYKTGSVCLVIETIVCQVITSLIIHRLTVSHVVLEHVRPKKVSGVVIRAQRMQRVLVAAHHHVNVRHGPST